MKAELWEFSHGADKNTRHEAENIEADYGSKNG